METSPEIWKVCEYRGQTLHDYEVSNLGNVRRATGPSAGRLRKPSLDTKKYPFLRLNLNGKKGNMFIHHLVAFTFIGPKPEGMEVDHIDRVITNNAATNLRYITHKENMRNRRYKSQGNAIKRSLRHYFGEIRITPEQAERIRAILDEENREN